MNAYYLGVDVGTGSVRAGIFDDKGQLYGSGKKDIQIWRDSGDIVEQSSEDIWQATIIAVQKALKQAAIPADHIKGIGFDATCSLVLIDETGEPISVNPGGESARNVIVWMDHRAMEQTDRINALHHSVLNYVGGKISPEMQTPKLLWLKEKLPQSYAAAAHFFDLSDYLTYRATGSLNRSVCTLVCKWTYLAHESAWRPDYFKEIELGDLAEEGFVRIGTDIVAPGSRIGSGLTAQAAEDLGLVPGTHVAAALIDAHAGALATIGGQDSSGKQLDPRRQLALIMGTSACCMSLSSEPTFVPGLWGPYFSALTQGLWLTEGGQSAAGAAVDHFMSMHPSLVKSGTKPSTELFETLERELIGQCNSLSDVAFVALDLHILPDVNGNRSPIADPHMRGAILGLDMATDHASLQRLYVSVLCGLAYGIADILEAQKACGFNLDTIVISGGAGRSSLVRQIIADATGLRVCLPETDEPVLLGAAMLGTVADGRFATLEDAMGTMSRVRAETLPAGGAVARLHERKRQIYKLMQSLDVRARDISHAQ